MYGNGCDNPKRQPTRNTSRGSSAYPPDSRYARRQDSGRTTIASSYDHFHRHLSTHHLIAQCMYLPVIFCWSVFVSSLTVIPFIVPVSLLCVSVTLKKQMNHCKPEPLLLTHPPLSATSTTTCRLYGAYTGSNIITSWCSYQGFAFGKKCCMCRCACMCG